MVQSFVWRDVLGTVGGGGSNGRWAVVSSDTEVVRGGHQMSFVKVKMIGKPPKTSA